MLTINSASFYKNFSAFHLVNEMNELAKPLFQSINANYFDYCRIYQDHSFFTLTTDCLWLEHFFKKKYRIASAMATSGKHLWSTINYNAITHDARAYHNHDHGISIFNQHDNYIEYFDIAAPKENYQIISTYLNNFNLIENFISEFLIKFEKLILQAKSHLILIPSEMSNPSETKNTPSVLPNKPALTMREQQCLKRFLAGQTAKETAEEFAISPRTVEQHINSVKTKYDCRRKRDLLKLFFSLGISL